MSGVRLPTRYCHRLLFSSVIHKQRRPQRYCLRMQHKVRWRWQENGKKQQQGARAQLVPLQGRHKRLALVPMAGAYDEQSLIVVDSFAWSLEYHMLSHHCPHAGHEKPRDASRHAEGRGLDAKRGPTVGPRAAVSDEKHTAAIIVWRNFGRVAPRPQRGPSRMLYGVLYP